MKKILFVLVLLLLFFGCKSKRDISKNEEKGAMKTLYMAAHREICDAGGGKKMCLLVKENPGDEWALFYDEIEGFDFVAGYEYTLKVKVEEVKNPPADGSSQKYKLVSVEDRKVPDYLASGLYDIWGLKKLNGKAVDLKAQVDTPMLEIDTKKKTITGSTGCNRFNSTFGFDIKSGSFRINTPVAQTKRGCPKGSIEQEFLKALESVDSYKKQGTTLLLMSNGKPVMELKKMD